VCPVSKENEKVVLQFMVTFSATLFYMCVL
jgi:hypothetical protein